MSQSENSPPCERSDTGKVESEFQIRFRQVLNEEFPSDVDTDTAVSVAGKIYQEFISANKVSNRLAFAKVLLQEPSAHACKEYRVFQERKEMTARRLSQESAEFARLTNDSMNGKAEQNLRRRNDPLTVHGIILPTFGTLGKKIARMYSSSSERDRDSFLLTVLTAFDNNGNELCGKVLIPEHKYEGWNLDDMKAWALEEDLGVTHIPGMHCIEVQLLRS